MKINQPSARCDIHVELADLNQDASALAAKIQEDFEGFGI